MITLAQVLENRRIDEVKDPVEYSEHNGITTSERLCLTLVLEDGTEVTLYSCGCCGGINDSVVDEHNKKQMQKGIPQEKLLAEIAAEDEELAERGLV